MEKEISLWEWLELKQKESVKDIIRFTPSTDFNDKLFCDLHTKFEKDKWDLSFNEDIRKNKNHNEIVLAQQELYKDYKLLLENTIVKIPSES